MKKLAIIICLVAGFNIVKAQSNKEDIDMIQAMYGKDKKVLVANFITLEGKQKDEFWKLYDEYETARKNTGRKRLALLEKYAAVYDTANNKQIDQLMGQMFALQSETDKLIQTYYNKMKLKAGYVTAAKFSQMEAYFASAIRAALLEKIPFFHQLAE